MRGVILAITCLAAPATGALGQTRPLYITDLSGDQVFVVQGGSLVNSFKDISVHEMALAVSGDVRTATYASHEPGRRYTLAGAYTGTSYPYAGVPGNLLDGSTDGVNYNYAVEWTGSPTSVFRYDREWQNPVALFDVPPASGITYDTSDGTVWVGLRGDGTTNEVRHYALDGTVLGSFGVTGYGGNLISLAYDESTGSLWVNGNANPTLLSEFSRSGALIGTVDVPAIVGDNLGAEFEIVPAPGAAACAAGLACGAFRRRRR